MKTEKNITKVIGTMFMAMVVLALAPASARADLVAWWNFNDGNAALGAGGVKDLATTGGNHDGTASSAAIFSTDVPAALAGTGSRSADLTAASTYIEVDTFSGGASENDFDMGASFTVAFWIKGWVTAWAGIVSKSNISSTGWTIRTHGRSPLTALELTLYGGGSNKQDYRGIEVNHAVWEHVAVTYDGSNIRFYKDGSLVNTVASTVVPDDHAGNLRIGCRALNIYTAKTHVDDVGIWNEVLDLAAIQDLAAGTDPTVVINPPAPGTLIYGK